MPFSTKANDKSVADVLARHNSSRNDTAYSANPSQIQQLEQSGYTNQGAVSKANSSPFDELNPIWPITTSKRQHLLARSPQEEQYLQKEGWHNDGVAFYSVRYPTSTSASGWKSA